MSYGEAISTCFRKYATFSGRARPSEYWWWVLFNVILFGVLYAIGGGASVEEPSDAIATVIGVVWLGLILPSWGVAIRRLHDTGRSGWFLLISLIPLVGGIVLLVFMVSAGNPGPNKYGIAPGMAVAEPSAT